MTRRALAVALSLAAALAAAPAAPAQRQPESNPFNEGTHAFRHMLYEAGRKNLTPLHDVSAVGDPSGTLIVVLGDPSPLKGLDRRLGGLESFVKKGGALLVATDYATPQELGTSFGVGVSGDFVALGDGDPDAWRGRGTCPFVEPVPGADPPLFQPHLPLGRGVAPPRVASNRPSHLRVARFGTPLDRLATLPPNVHVEASGKRADQDFAYGLDYSGTSGRVLIVADHSVFINVMMLQTDNGNLDFGYRCADWLMARPGSVGREPRDQVLYYEDGTVKTDFNIPLKDLPMPPLPPPDTLMGILDELHAMEEEGTFVEMEGKFAQMERNNHANRMIQDVAKEAPLWEGSKPEVKLWTLAVIAVSVGLGVYSVVRLGAFRHRPESAGPLLTDLLARQAPAGVVLAQRQEEQLRDGNLWEAARDLARQLFAGAGVMPDAGPLPPVIDVSGGWWQRWRTRLRWRQLWRLARSPRPVRVSPRGFARLAGRVRALRAALAGGTVRLVP
jgi:hypothetical protein